jgi:hypothetical protein
MGKNAFAATLQRNHAHDAGHKKAKDPCLASLPKNCHAWTIAEVQIWMKSIKMDKFLELFDDIDGKAMSECGSEHGAFDAYLLDWGVDDLLERKRMVHSWDAYLHRWRFTADVNPFQMTKQHSKFSSKWKVAGANTLMNDRIEHLLGAKNYSGYSTVPVKTEIAGDYSNYLDLLDLDLETSVRGRTKHKMDTMSFKELVERKKHIARNYSGTNKHISNKQRARVVARKQAQAMAAQEMLSPSRARKSQPMGSQMKIGSPPIFDSWKNKGKYIDVAHWKSELIGNKRLYRPQGGDTSRSQTAGARRLPGR